MLTHTVHSQNSPYKMTLVPLVNTDQQPEGDCTLAVMPGQLHSRTLMKENNKSLVRIACLTR